MLLNRDHIQKNLRRIVIGVDPAVTHGESSNETGIVVAGVTGAETGYILEDLSLRGPATLWSQKIVEAYHAWQADRVVAEINQGGDLVESMLRSLDPMVSYRGVRATRGKRLRAEPIASLYEQRKVFHIEKFPELEHQMCKFTGKSSVGTDRLDALVWALTELFLDSSKPKSRSCPRIRMLTIGT